MAAGNEEEVLVFQVYLVGDSGVGKSCLLQRFTERTYREWFTPTIGVDFRTSTIKLEGKTIRLQISDVAGREEYRTVVPDYYKKAHGFIIVFDVTDETSFFGVNERLHQLDRLGGRNARKILVGNKCDNQAEKVISSEMAEELASIWGMRFLEASAKDGTHVAQVFLGIAEEIKNRLPPRLEGPHMAAQHVECSPRQERITVHRPNQAGDLCIERINMNQPNPVGRLCLERIKMNRPNPACGSLLEKSNMHRPSPAGGPRLERINPNRPNHAGSTSPLQPRKRSSAPCDYTFNIILIGDSGVGKSCLMLRFTDAHYRDVNSVTICQDFRSRIVELEGHTVKLLIMDTAGQEQFHSITSSYYRGADGIILVYDVTRKVTFDNLRTWLEDIDVYAREDTDKLLVGNKSDMMKEKVVSHRSGQRFANELGIPFLEASAKSAANVDKVFKTLAALIKKRMGPPRNRKNTGNHNDPIRLESTEGRPTGTENSKKWYKRC